MKFITIVFLLLSTFFFAQSQRIGVAENVEPKDRIAFTMYTVHDNTVKLLAQFHPIRNFDPMHALLQVKESSGWVTRDSAEIIYPGFTAHFRIDNWDDTQARSYRVVYNKEQKDNIAFYEGTIRQNPIDKEEFVMGVFSCNSNFAEHGGSRSRQDIVDNMLKIDPDLLFFAGDQMYNHSEHYWYWLEFGKQFGQLFRNIPTITIPDDHDIGQANLWGESGKKGDDRHGWNGGYVMPVAYIEEVERAQTDHLPDPYDPTPVKQGIGVHYTALTWGGISFAIIEDRKFKSAPGNVLSGNINESQPLDLDVPGATLLGERQLAFLEDWSDDWTNAEMKAVLSATIFASVNTESGSKENKMDRDFDANGWPQTGRNKALSVIRKSYACMIGGDQHLGTVVHHGINDWGDAGYSFATPAIANLWMRWWEPEHPGKNPREGLPYTGEFYDGFQNKMTIMAVANPTLKKNEPNEDLLKSRGAGIGVVRFHKKTRDITFECWPRNVDITDPNSQPLPGWPFTFNQLDNYIIKNGYQLPTIKSDQANQVITIRDGYTKALISSLRIKGHSFQPIVPNAGEYDIHIGEGDHSKILYRVKAEKENKEVVKIQL